jgi:hypothetical protein
MGLKAALICSLAFFAVTANAQWFDLNPIKAIRFDPSYVYDLPELAGLSSPDIAARVAADIASAGFNTVFLWVYSPVYGAFYNTNYSMSHIEAGIGREDFTRHFLTAAKARGLKVIALFHVNNYQKVWQQRPDWRVKNRKGGNYRPFSDVFPLSAFSPPYQSWLRGLLKDFLVRHPTIDGLEAFEAMVDYSWNDGADYNVSANNTFFRNFPQGRLGDSNWKKLQADALTLLQAIVFQEANLLSKESHVVQTWSATPEGQLMNSKDIADGCAFDFDGVLNLTGISKPKFITIEVMWQQWLAEYGSPYFNFNWVLSAGQQLKARVANRATPIVHIELSEFEGSSGTIVPTDMQFLSDLTNAVSLGLPIDVYDYFQIKSRSLLGRVAEVLH